MKGKQKINSMIITIHNKQHKPAWDEFDDVSGLLLEESEVVWA